MAALLRKYIASFRIKELQLCLEQLGLSKRGRKLELQNRLLTYLGDSKASQSSDQPSDIWKANAAGSEFSSLSLASGLLPVAAEQQTRCLQNE